MHGFYIVGTWLFTPSRQLRQGMNFQVRELTIRNERSFTYPEKNKDKTKEVIFREINEAPRDACYLMSTPS